MYDTNYWYLPKQPISIFRSSDWLSVIKSSDSGDYMETLYRYHHSKIYLCQNTFFDDNGDGGDGSDYKPGFNRILFLNNSNSCRVLFCFASKREFERFGREIAEKTSKR